MEITESSELPFFIEWHVPNHPSKDGRALSEIKNLIIASQDELSNSLFKDQIHRSLNGVTIEWEDIKNNENSSGIIAVIINTPNGIIRID